MHVKNSSPSPLSWRVSSRTDTDVRSNHPPLTYNTYMENLTHTYVSPRTGTEYLVVPQTLTRMAGDWYKGEPLRPVEYTQWDIVLRGNLVQFCFNEADIPDAVRHFEEPGWDGWTTSPRD